MNIKEIWRKYKEPYSIRNHCGFEDFYFYEENKENEPTEIFKLYRLLLLLLEAKIGNPKDVDLFIEQVICLYQNTRTDIGIERNKRTEDLWQALEKLPNVKREELLTVYGRVLNDIEVELYITPDLKVNNEGAIHRVAMLHKVAKVKWRMARIFVPVAFGIYHCFRCKDKKYAPILLRCGHMFCKECLGLWCIISFVCVPKKELIIKCPECNYLLNNVEINQVIKDTVYYDKYEKKKYPFKCKDNVCVVCGEDGINGDLLAMGCKNAAKNKQEVKTRAICEACVINIFKKADNIKKNECSCFCPYCEEERKGTKIQKDDMYCPCGKSSKDNEHLFFKCKCSYLYCSDCILSLNSCLYCKESFLDPNGKLRGDIKNVVLKDPKKRECPSCSKINDIEKAQDEFVSCSKCKVEFCTACLIKKELIKGHGKSYHLLKCRHYNKEDILDACKRCQKQNPCPNPNPNA